MEAVATVKHPLYECRPLHYSDQRKELTASHMTSMILDKGPALAQTLN